jgi:hypothetical protein
VRACPLLIAALGHEGGSNLKRDWRSHGDGRHQSQRPQSSSASRFTADARGFLILSQCGERPERYAEPSRLETMPSQPSLHACFEYAVAVTLVVLLSTMPGCGPRTNRASFVLRCSMATKREQMSTNIGRNANLY